MNLLKMGLLFRHQCTIKVKKPIVVIKEIKEKVDWVNYMDSEVMKTSGDVFAITNEEPSDPSTFIMPIVGLINNWT